MLIVFIFVPKNSGLKKYRQVALDSFNFKNPKVVEVRGEDVPFWVNALLDKTQVIGLTGSDLFETYCMNGSNNLEIVKVIKWFDPTALFNKPVLCLLGPKNKKLSDFSSCVKIAVCSKYKKLVEEYVKTLLFDVELIYFSGSVELSYTLGISDLVMDIVYSGKSMKETGLKVYDKIIESDFVVIGGKK